MSTAWLTIKNYRPFVSLDVRPLARVNVFFGQNNTGKTALLEAVELAWSEDPLAGLVASCRRRGARVGPFPAEGGQQWAYPIVDAFRRPAGGGARMDRIEVGAEGGLGAAVSLVTGRVVIDKGALRFVREASGRSLALERASGTHGPFSDLFPFDTPQGVFERNVQALGYQTGFVPQDGLGEQDLTLALDAVRALGRHHLELVPLLARLVGDLQGVVIVKEQVAQGFQRRLGIQRGDGEVQLLPNLGDGVRRALGIGLQMLATPEHLPVIIDEIENGLHHTVLVDMWRWLIRIAWSTQRQVFAATHSRDCLEALARVVMEEPALGEQVTAHRLTAGLESTVHFRGEELVKAWQDNIEIRR